MMLTKVNGISILSDMVIDDAARDRRERERLTVSRLLARFFGYDVNVLHDSHGAPFLPGNDYHISISHSSTRVVVALARRAGFGIDTETLRPQLQRVKDKFLNPEELTRFSSTTMMLRAWSAKEAVYKAAMTPGLALKNIRLVSDNIASANGERYRLTTVEEGSDFITVLADRQLPVGRFAPSPSGRMHLGNIFAAVMSYKSVKERGGKWILRIEDLDSGRSKIEYSRMIEDDLHWLGLDWDEGGLDDRGPNGPYRQSMRGDIYELYLNKLIATGFTYPCTCTRAQIMATNAPHQSDGRVIYGGRCRPALLPDHSLPPSTPHATRLYVPSREITFYDRNFGKQHFNLAQDCGDFILRRADGAWAYQLAVVVDDALMGVTEVVRGADLLLSAAQQIYLYELLGLEAPDWAHIPLITSADGQRLSKRDRSLSMEELRQRYTPGQLLDIIANLPDTPVGL